MEAQKGISIPLNFSFLSICNTKFANKAAPPRFHRMRSAIAIALLIWTPNCIWLATAGVGANARVGNADS